MPLTLSSFHPCANLSEPAAATCFVDDIAAGTLGLTDTAACKDKAASKLSSTPRDNANQTRDAEIMADFTAWRSSLAERGGCSVLGPGGS